MIKIEWPWITGILIIVRILNHLRLHKVKQINAKIKPNLIIVIPVTTALLESQQVSKGSCISLNSETPWLPLTIRNPWNIYVEAVQIICGTQLCCTHFHRHEVEVGTHLHWQSWCQFNISAQTESLGECLLVYNLAVRELICFPETEVIVEVQWPRYIRICII